MIMLRLPKGTLVSCSMLDSGMRFCEEDLTPERQVKSVAQNITNHFPGAESS